MELFWTSINICLGFHSQGGFPCLRASSSSSNGLFTFGTIPADLLTASKVAELCTCMPSIRKAIYANALVVLNKMYTNSDRCRAVPLYGISSV